MFRRILKLTLIALISCSCVASKPQGYFRDQNVPQEQKEKRKGRKMLFWSSVLFAASASFLYVPNITEER